MTYLYSHCKVCAWVLALAIAISSGSVLAVDQYNDDFEATGEGSLPAGWGAAAGSAVVTAQQANVTWTGTEPNSAGTKLMYVAQDADATNGTPVVSATSSNVWVDMWVAPNLYDGVATNRSFADVSGSSAAFFFDTNGYVVVNQGSGSTNWTVISTDLSGTALAIADNDSATNMQRVTVYMDYDNDVYDLLLNGSLVKEDIPFNTTASSMTKLTLSDDVYADMITVSATNYPGADSWDAGVALNSDEDYDGMLDVWELHYFGAVATHYGSTDSDNDGRTDVEEHQDGTDPTESGDKSWVIPYFEKFAGVASVPTEVTTSYRAFTKLAGTATVTDTAVGAMSDDRGIALSAGGLQVVVTNANATNVFCQVYVKPVPCPEAPSNAITDEAAAICVVDNVLYAYSGGGWVDAGVTNDNLTNGTWVGLAAHLNYNDKKWDLYYSINDNFVTRMTRVNDNSYDFRTGFSGTEFQSLTITNESSVTTHVDAVAVSLSYAETEINAHTNLAIFERMAGRSESSAPPPYDYGSDADWMLLNGAETANTALGQDMTIGLFTDDEVRVPDHDGDLVTYRLQSSGVWTKIGADPQPTNSTATSMLIAREPGSDTLAFYPYSNIVSATLQQAAYGVDHDNMGQTDVVLPTLYSGGCIDINHPDMTTGFTGLADGDSLMLYRPEMTPKTRKYYWNDTQSKWLYYGAELPIDICPGDAFMIYHDNTGEVTYEISL